MNFRIERAAFSVLSFVLCQVAAIPAVADEIPTYQILTCEQNCPRVTKALPLQAPLPNYPFKYQSYLDSSSEAVVDIDFSVGTDGNVTRAVVENLLGAKEFASSALEAIRDRHYKPASEDGQPVEENHRVQFTFVLPTSGHFARDYVVRADHDANDLARKGQMTEAVAMLRQLAAKPALTLFERTTLNYDLAVKSAFIDDLSTARDAIRVATISDGEYLDKRAIEPAFRLRMHVEAATGELAEALAWFDKLQKRNSLAPTDPDAQLAAKLRAVIASAPPLGTDAVVPSAGEPEFWQHTLLRRSFEFNRIEGKLDRFDLNCEHHSIRSVVSDKADWTVPKSWNGCVINVFGAPGAKFQFVELQPASR